jgi:hypothetical protein
MNEGHHIIYPYNSWTENKSNFNVKHPFLRLCYSQFSRMGNIPSYTMPESGSQCLQTFKYQTLLISILFYDCRILLKQHKRASIDSCHWVTKSAL